MRAQGNRARFTYTDYALKIVLGSSMRKYFMLDQGQYRPGAGAGGGYGGYGGQPTAGGGPGGGYQTTYVASSGGCCVTM
jgi:hypothetical protein